jgi:hypothetical protein
MDTSRGGKPGIYPHPPHPVFLRKISELIKEGYLVNTNMKD